MFKKYKDRIEFFIVYIREAHPSDGWQVSSNKRDKVVYKTPKTLKERSFIATKCLQDMKLSIPFLIDDMKGTVNKAYAGWPVRACLINKQGTISYYSKKGPWGFKPQDIEKAIKAILNNREAHEIEKREAK